MQKNRILFLLLLPEKIEKKIIIYYDNQYIINIIVSKK